MKISLLVVVGAACSACAGLGAAEPIPPPAPAAVNAEVFDALVAIAGAQGDTYSISDVQRLCRAVWWDVTFDRDEQVFTRRLNDQTRPLLITCVDGRSLAFAKKPTSDTERQQRFLLPSRFSPNDSSYFVDAFRNLKDAGVYIGACRVHENAATIMETALNDMVNQARYRAKTAGDKVVVELFAELEAGWRDANPGIQGEFADAVRRIVGRFNADPRALPAAVRQAAWLQPPGA